MPPRKQKHQELPEIPEEQENLSNQEQERTPNRPPLSQRDLEREQQDKDQDIQDKLQEVQASISQLVTTLKGFSNTFQPRQQKRFPNLRTQEEDQNIEFLTGSDPSNQYRNYYNNPMYNQQDEYKSQSQDDLETRPRNRNAPTTIVMAPKVIPYDGDENPESWLKVFKRSMQKQGTQEIDYLDEIPYWLKGKALNWFELNDESFKGRFNIFQTKFLKKYHKDPEIYESKLLTTKQRNNQTLEEYLNYLQKLAKPAKISEQKIKVAFIEGLKEKDVRRHARQSFLFQNNQYDLDRILFSLQEYEYDSKYSYQGTRYDNKDKDKDKGRINTYSKENSHRDQKASNYKDMKKKANMVEGENKIEDELNEVFPESDDESSQGDDEIDPTINLIECNMIESENTFLPKVYIRIIGPITPSRHANKYVIIVFDRHSKIWLMDTLPTKDRYSIKCWLEGAFLKYFSTKLMETTRERCFLGPTIISFLDEQDITQLYVIYEHEWVIRILQQINENIDHYNRSTLDWEDDFIAKQSAFITNCFPNEQSQVLHIDSNEESKVEKKFPIDQSTTMDIVSNVNSKNLHRQLVDKIKKAKYIPAKSAKSFAEATLANMSLAQVMEVSPSVSKDWINYGQTCLNNLENKEKEQKQKNDQEIQDYLSNDQANIIMDQQNIPVLKNVGFDYLPCKIYGLPIKGMIDTGANVSLISEQYLRKNNLLSKAVKSQRVIGLGDGNNRPIIGILKQVPISLDDTFNVIVDLLITKASNYELLFGRNIQKTLQMAIYQDKISYKNPFNQKQKEILYCANVVEEKEENEEKEDLNVLVANNTTKNLTSKINQTLYPNFPKDKKFQLILVDPPWQYDINVVPSLTPPYQTLSIGQLQSLPIKQISDENAILLMWTTGPMLGQAINLIKEYGYNYRTILFTWLKTDQNDDIIQGKGNYTAPCTELLLIATRGKIKDYFKDKLRVSQLIKAPIIRHSQKPDIVYEQIAKILPISKMQNLEIFARKRIKHFIAYGNELPKEQVNLVEVLPETIEQVNQMSIGPLNQNQKMEVQNLVQQNVSQFATSLAELGSSNIGEHTIKLKLDYKPNQQSPYRLSKPETEFVNQEIEDLLSQGFIKEDVGEWASPILVVKKANGKYRMCVDFRKLNQETIDEKFPIPRIDDIFAQLQGKRYFTKLDLKSGFWQINIAQNSQMYTGFITPQGQYYWLRMPFGLKNAPSTFQRCMQKVFQKVIRKFVMVYIDDIIIYSNTFEDHMSHLDWVFKRLKDVNLKLGPDKCVLFQETLDILGHTISFNQIQPMKNKVVAIEKIKPPTNKTEVRSFLGLTGYYRQFIPNFSKIAQPLYKVSGETQQWEWEIKQEQAFNMLKLALMENPILHLCVDDKPFTLYTDFSYQGLGAVLTQHINPKKEMVIEFASRTLFSYEKNLDPYQGEVLAVYWSLDYFRHYLLGREFTLVTDNKALEWVMKLSNPSRKINRWLVDIMEYNFKVKHRKGTTHNNADALSRLVSEPQKEEGVAFIHDIGDIHCKICHKKDPKNMLLCDYCGDAIHTTCINLQNIPLGPFYCRKCLQEISQLDKKDITVDFNVIDYLKYEELPLDPIEQNRIIRRASNYIIRDEHIYYMSKKGLRLVPTISQRPELVKERHSIAGHQSVIKTLQLIQQDYIWVNLYKDVVQMIKSCTICNAMNPKFSLSKEYFPTEKGQKPFDVVAIDLITNFPSTKKGNKHVIIAIDAFSKFVELGAIPNKRSLKIRDFIVERIICRHGCPSIIRSDKGKEFLGAAKSLLQQYNIQQKVISTGYPEGNAQAERTVQTVERILRRYLLDNNVPMEWDEILPYVERSMRATIAKSTKVSPYECLYGKPMKLPDSVSIQLQNYQDEDILDIDIAKYARSLKGVLAITQKEALKELKREDERQKRVRQQDIKHKEIKFQPGQLVYLRKMRQNKLEAPVLGPFQFVKYLKKGVVTLINPQDNSTFQQNANQLALTQI